ncbi:NAD-dependent protein deacetylase hst1 [Colletotrichum chlorophyti]|uniref:NAD-dependent protein deacetylase hst1 n=1 Tax=Colletotrichum chlorophyti TaxID=708187 RepID=A0A1Q8RLF6_9PEZI|nr:NAD-dependent protein deacetylase hst1 [Colletotrichum chlorophyti]
MKTQRAAATKSVTVKKRNNNKPSKSAAYKVDSFKAPENPSLEDIKHAVGLRELEERVRDAKESAWETDSLLEDAIAEMGDAKLSPADEDCCTPDEAMGLRHQLRALGPAEFCRTTVDAGRYTAKKLLSAFGLKPPAFLEGADDEAYFSLLSLAISRELSKRAKLFRYNTVDDAVTLLQRSQNIIVLTGAGISTSLGIPDFRSKGTGLYSQLEHLGLNDPQEVFDISVFKQDPTIFYTVAKDILPSTNRFTPTHAFISMLQKKGKLLTNYTQNIDNLEAKAGISSEKMIQCHGSFATATCVQCGFKCVGEEIFPDIKAGKIPRCPQCIQNVRPNGSTKRKRSAGTERKRRRFSSDDSTDSEYDIPSVGVMKPDITFFGEALPDEFSRRLTEHDRDKVDLVIVIGTSLKVTPVSEIVSWLPANIPQIYISRQAVNHINFDIDLLGDCDVVVSELCRRAGWPLKHEMVPEDQVVNVRPDGGCVSRHVFEVVKPESATPATEVPRPKIDTTKPKMEAKRPKKKTG